VTGGGVTADPRLGVSVLSQGCWGVTEGLSSGKGRAREHELQRACTSAEVKGKVDRLRYLAGAALIRPADGPDT